MSLCERLVVFEHRYGKRRSLEQQAAIERGRCYHKRFYREGRIASLPPGRCFIATKVLGEEPETPQGQLLRRLRACGAA